MKTLSKKHIKSQTLAETVVVAMVFVVAMMVMSKYIKHSLRGRWKSSADSGFGQAFDPKTSSFKTVYQKSGQSENVILMEKQVINQTNEYSDYYDAKTSNEVWFHTSYQIAGPGGVKDANGNYVIANDTSRQPLREVRSEQSTTQWKDLGEQ